MKIFILGLDGATLDILNPLMERNVTPNIKSLVTTGSYGRLRSIFPPVTAPAWLALATGLNPGKTGVFDYINKTDAENAVWTPVSSAYYKNRAIWDYLGKAGYRVGVYNYPTLQPPPRVEGFAVSGMGGKKGSMCFPIELEEELDKTTCGYESRLNLRRPEYKRNIDLFFYDINRIISKQAGALQYLVKEKEWDFFFAVFSFTDWMQHVLWKDIDEDHPLYDSRKSPEIKIKFDETWKKIDDIIGELSVMLPDDTNVMLVSDHGMGPIDSVFYPNTWLGKRGWLKRKDQGWKSFFIKRLKLFSEGSDNKYYSAFLHILRSKILGINGTMDLIDFENSLAYSPEHNTMFGCVNLTQLGKNTKGFKQKLIEEMRDLARSLDDIQNVEIYLPEEIYSGPYANLSPDIFFVLNDHKSTVEIDFSEEPFMTSPSIEMRSGGHRMDGIFIGAGSVFKNIGLENISILDVAPTVMALYGIEIPLEVDGRVLSECIKPEVLGGINVRVRKDQRRESHQEIGMKEEELEDMKKLLRSLGYL